MSWYRHMIGKAEAVEKELDKAIVGELTNIKYGASEFGKKVAEFEKTIVADIKKIGTKVHLFIESQGHFDPNGTGQMTVKIQTVPTIEDYDDAAPENGPAPEGMKPEEPAAGSTTV